MNSLFSSLLRFDDNTLTNSIVQIMTQYNRNQELYNQNMEMMLTTIDSLLQSRNFEQRRNNNAEQPRRNVEQSEQARYNQEPREQVYEFTLPSNISDMLLQLLDPSGQSIPLSSRQIAEATTVYNHHSTSTDPLICPISLEPIENNESVMKINRCGHIFKEQSLRRWLERNQRCPVCRCNL